MHHPDACAKHLRLRSTWRDLTERGSRDHEALDWRDACLALGGCTGLAYDAFAFRFSENAPSRTLLQHLLDVARQALGRNDTVTAEQLVELLVREERAPANQRSEKHRYVACGVSRYSWEKFVARPYARIGQELECLVSDAWRTIRSRIE